MKRVLFSVTDKTGLAGFGKDLLRLYPHLEILASGGTAKELEKEGIPYKPIQEAAQFPECFGGRIKTLHPKIIGGILYRRGVDDAEAAELNIEPIDLVVCNLYVETQLDSIDIGGSTLIRAACKNHESVAVVTDPNDYSRIVEEITACGALSLNTKQQLATKAIQTTASYDARIAENAVRSIALENGRKLSYGENPDQEGWVYAFPGQKGIASAPVLGGKPLSYNNYEDASQAFYAAWRIAQDANPGCVIVKHGNPCGYATGRTVIEAFQRAWDGDPKSAFGGIIAFTRGVGEELCEELQSRFIEVILAPAFSEEFLAWAKAKKPSLRLLQVDFDAATPLFYRGISGGMLVQTPKKPLLNKETLRVATKRQPKQGQEALFAFALAAVYSVKSNAIVLVREYAPSLYQLIGVGSGQPNRIDSMQKLAIPKALEVMKKEEKGFEDVVLASDGFFPFEDGVQAAAEWGIQTILQPGGGVRDPQIIAEADNKDLCMLLTGQRYFNH